MSLRGLVYTGMGVALPLGAAFLFLAKWPPTPSASNGMGQRTDRPILEAGDTSAGLWARNQSTGSAIYVAQVWTETPADVLACGVEGALRSACFQVSVPPGTRDLWIPLSLEKRTAVGDVYRICQMQPEPIGGVGVVRTDRSGKQICVTVRIDAVTEGG